MPATEWAVPTPPELPQCAVARFARQDILLVLDGAPNHRCRDLVAPDDVSLLVLRPYDPKENPWDEIREKIFKNYALKSIETVHRKLEEAILYVERNPELVRSITGFSHIVSQSNLNLV
jgi:hypothetical protein